MGTIVTAPRPLAFAWRVIRTWLDEPTRQKVQICAAEAEWKPVLRELIDDTQLHIDYGGKAFVPATAEGRAAWLIRGPNASDEQTEALASRLPFEEERSSKKLINRSSGRWFGFFDACSCC